MPILLLLGVFGYWYYDHADFFSSMRWSYIKYSYVPAYARMADEFFDISRMTAALANIQDESNVQEEHKAADPAKGIPVLTYHGIVEDDDSVNVTVKKFREQMFALKEEGYETITIEEFRAFMHEGKELPEKSFLLTFDDGRKDSYYPVDPILRALDYEAVTFVITEHSLSGTEHDYYLNEKELKRMVESGKWDIQAHTYRGHDPYKISASGELGYFYSNKLWRDGEKRLETKEEFTQRVKNDFLIAKNTVQEKLGTESISFAYPFGDFGQESVNFPEAEFLVPEIAKSVYPVSFRQVRKDSSFSVNYPNANESLFERIEVKPEWSGDDVVKILDMIRHKPLPYVDTFSDYHGWVKTWGLVHVDFDDSGMILRSDVSTNGSSVFLEGSYLWQDYLFQSRVDFVKGESFSLRARYVDEKNYVACTYTPEFIRIEQRINGQIELIREARSTAGVTGQHTSIGIEVLGNTVSCYRGDALIIAAYNVERMPEHGGIGFETWSPEVHASEMIVKEISVEEI